MVILLIINEEAKQYAIQTMDNARLTSFEFPLFKRIMAQFFPMSKLFYSSMLQSLINLMMVVKLPTRQAMRGDI